MFAAESTGDLIVASVSIEADAKQFAATFARAFGSKPMVETQ